MTNTFAVSLTDGREVFFSYGVAVAAFIPGRGYIKTDRKWSTTTSKHANAYCPSQYGEGKATVTVPDAEFCALVAPIECKGR